jgi:hypothetical protein
MKLSEIKISNAFAETSPKKEKISKCYEHWKNTGTQDRFIIVDYNNVLVDGYIMYLVLKELGVEIAFVKIQDNYKNNPTVYIYGTHQNPYGKLRKTYIWRVPESWTSFANTVDVGDVVLCQTRFGVSLIVVNKVEAFSKCPVNIPVKKIVSRNIIRNGMLVKG